METFGIVGMVFGILGMGLGANALIQIKKLETQLREAGILDKAQ